MSRRKETITEDGLKATLESFKKKTFKLDFNSKHGFYAAKDGESFKPLEFNYLGELKTPREAVTIRWSQINRNIMNVVQKNFSSGIARFYIADFFGVQPDDFANFEDFKKRMEESAADRCKVFLHSAALLNFKRFISSAMDGVELELKDKDRNIEMSFDIRLTVGFTMENSSELLSPDMLFSGLIAGMDRAQIFHNYEVEAGKQVATAFDSRYTTLVNTIRGGVDSSQSPVTPFAKDMVKYIGSNLPGMKDFSLAAVSQPGCVQASVVASKPLTEDKKLHAYCDIIETLVGEIKDGKKKESEETAETTTSTETTNEQ